MMIIDRQKYSLKHCLSLLAQSCCRVVKLLLLLPAALFGALLLPLHSLRPPAAQVCNLLLHTSEQLSQHHAQ